MFDGLMKDLFPVLLPFSPLVVTVVLEILGVPFVFTPLLVVPVFVPVFVVFVLSPTPHAAQKSVAANRMKEAVILRTEFHLLFDGRAGVAGEGVVCAFPLALSGGVRLSLLSTLPFTVSGVLLQA
jgi:hypothetical protein